MMTKVLPKLQRRILKAPTTPTPYHVEASIYAFRHFILAQSEICHAGSYWDPDGLDIFLPTDADDGTLGDAAWAVLRAARFVRPGEPGWEKIVKPRDQLIAELKVFRETLLKRAGVTTQRALYEGAKYVSLWRQDGEIRIHALARKGYDSWTGIPGEKDDIYPDRIGEADLGRAVRKALERAVG